MGLSDDGYDEVDQRFEALCFDLNMDTHAKEEAWASYQRIRKNFTLEGDQIFWLVCALYEACRRSVVPTVARGTVEGNCVSLTRLLRSARFNLIQFFDKIRKWSDMASLPQEFRNKIDRLERNFAVSTVIFKKFAPIFLDVFKNPADDPVRTPRGRKQKRQPCTVTDVFNFCWTMFVQVKGNFPAISDDLVNSYHLLLCCLDWIHANVVLAGRNDLLNPAFSGATATPDVPPCIVSVLCAKHEGLEVEAMGIKEHWWKLHIRKLFDKKILRGKSETLSGVLDLGNFETNQKTINNAYDEYVLTVGDFDERIFLGEFADEEIGTPAKTASFISSTGELRDRLQDKANLQRHFDQTKSLCPSTPLTGRLYLSEKEACITPVSTATQSVGRLQALLCGRSTCPSDTLKDIFSSCSRNPHDFITQKIRSMGETYCLAYARPAGDEPGFHVDFAKKRLQLGESLYYKVLENILLQELRLCQVKDTKPDLSALLEQDIFHSSLFSLCLEVVIFSYNSQRIFPWIIDAFDLSPYQFYKVIEILIRAEDGLSRDVVKHLNHIEERILEASAWRSDSGLWDAIKSHKGGVPTCEEVMLPSEATLPQLNPVVRRILPNSDVLRPILPKDSPVRFSATERFLSPKPGSTKRRLFTSDDKATTGAPAHNPASSFVAPGSSVSLLKSSAATATASPRRDAPNRVMAFQQTKTEDGTPILIPISTRSSATKLNSSPGGTNVSIAPKVVALSPRQISTSSSTKVPSPVPAAKSDSCPTKVAPCHKVVATDRLLVSIKSESGPATTATSSLVPSGSKPRRIGSLGLFFRKVYHLASVRLRDLCQRLGTPDDVQQKIWTCFEYCLMHHTDLLMDRHLDQLLMCAVYVMTKIVNQSVSFQEIMKNYRQQPQAQSHIYRSVLLTDRRRHASGSSDGSRSGANSRPTSPANDDHKDTRKRRAEMSIRSTSTLPVPQPSSHPPTPTKLYGAGNGATFDFGEERGDVIVFYNQVYVRRMQNFVKKFSSKTGQEHPLLSPFPKPRTHPSSPRRVNNKCQVYISPYKTGSAPTTPTKGRLYCFDRSPAKDLHEINDMIRMGDRISLKHALPAEAGGPSAAKKAMYQSPLEKKLQRITAERREVNGDV